MTVDVDLVVLATVEEALQLVHELDSTCFAPLFPGVASAAAAAEAR
jgi:hypothetical protein